MAPHNFSFALDSLHSLVCFWVCEDGIWRRNPTYQIASFLFQDLYSQRENVFYIMITRSIRHHLSKDVHKFEKGVFSSKSLCISSVTEMAAHWGVNFFEIHARSGHSLGTNQERYLDRNILALTLPSAYALNGWVNSTPNKSYPRFHCLGPHMTEQYHCLIN